MRIWILLFSSLLASLSAHGSTICYNESSFPSAIRIENENGAIVALLGGTSWEEKSQTVATVRFTDGQWRSGTRRPSTKYSVMAPAYRKCTLDIPLPKLTAEEAHRLRQWSYKPDEFDQYVTACVDTTAYVYFGLGIYQGEGLSGVGGVGRLDKHTNTVEIHRPLLLRDTSVTAIAHDGTNLWLGTAKESECSGLIATHGLLRYEWDTQIIEQQDEFTGLVVHDLLATRGELWAASDLGVTRVTREMFNPRWVYWTHWTYTGNEDAPMRQEGQFELYTRLARTLSAKPDDAGSSPFNYFSMALARVNPHAAVTALRDAFASRPQERCR